MPNVEVQLILVIYLEHFHNYKCLTQFNLEYGIVSNTFFQNTQKNNQNHIKSINYT